MQGRLSAANHAKVQYTTPTKHRSILVRLRSCAQAEVSLVELTKTDSHCVKGTLRTSCTLSEAVQDLAKVGSADAKELILLGAVYAGEYIKAQNYIKWRRAIDYYSNDPVGQSLQPGTEIRVHPHPKRFPACYTTHWPATVLYSDHDYVVINKPANLPSMRHESNAVEDIATCAAMGLNEELLEVCHRLDQWTTGVLVLSKNKDANRRFKEALQLRDALQKTYQALTLQPVPLGRLQHYMYDGPFNERVQVLQGGRLRSRGPRLLSHTPLPTWRLCELEVLECEESSAASSWVQKHGLQPSAGMSANGTHSTNISDASSDVTSTSASKAIDSTEADGSSSNGNSSSSSSSSNGCSTPPKVYRSIIRLITGRTHQIRAQLAAINRPLVGDVMYRPIAGFLVREAGVVQSPQLVQLIEDLPQLDGPIGLHAWQLHWGDKTFTAPAPWEAP